MTRMKKLALRSGVLATAVAMLAGSAGAQLIGSVPSANATVVVADGGSVDLCALAGSATLPDPADGVGSASIPIWGYAVKVGPTCGDDESAALPGPTLELALGSTVTVSVTNALPGSAGNTSIVFPGFAGVPDPQGVAAGANRSYTITASRPGTLAYESGVNAARQVAMGLTGTIIVRSDTLGSAYGGAATFGSAYDQEIVAVLSEVDPAQHAAPATFAYADYRPRLWLIDGSAYDAASPGDSTVSVGAGTTVLIRYVNAGFGHHAMTILGNRQTIIARDGFPVPAPMSVVDETVPSGQTMDVLVTVPASAASGTRYAVYDRQLHVTNGPVYPGGMLMFLEVA
jgi:FtsP/CotA-like multicopper oxidase with cupredoxin domain